ncbi:MAG: caspase family protein [Cypionkella sp.]
MTKYAVIVGINDYSVQGVNSLAMCVRDARAFYHLLIDAFDFDPTNIYTYLDLAADSAVILRALRFCVAQSQPGDVICFYYSGHGSRLPHPRNIGQFYEVIIPASGRWISDHELFLISDGLQPSFVNFTCVFDSCHSGGMSAEIEAKSPPMEQTLSDLIVQTMNSLVPCGSLLRPEDRIVCEANVQNVHMSGGRISLDPSPNFTTLPQAKTTLISGCAPNELSYEGPLTSTVRNGLMTKSLLDLVNQSLFRIDHRSLVQELDSRVAAYVTQLFPSASPPIIQRPQLVGQDNRMGQDFLAGFTDSR